MAGDGVEQLRCRGIATGAFPPWRELTPPLVPSGPNLNRTKTARRSGRPDDSSPTWWRRGPVPGPGEEKILEIGTAPVIKRGPG
jgi:hypothetical protein